MIKWLTNFVKGKETWEILVYKPYIDISYSLRIQSIQYEAVSSKGKYINSFLWGCELTKDQLLDLLNKGIKVKGRFK